MIGAWRLSGNKWPWTHGSNYAARYRTSNLHTVNSEADLSFGNLVYKGRNPGDDKYDLPSKYKSGNDLTDYYHVGVVVNTAPLQIMHCTTVDGGIKIDTKLGAWKYTGGFNLLDEREGEDKMGGYPYKATVTADSGKTVNMRKAPDTTAKAIKAVPIGETVEVTDDYNDKWAAIVYEGKNGYMMREFLKAEDPGDEAAAKIRQATTLLEEALTLLNGGVG